MPSTPLGPEPAPDPALTRALEGCLPGGHLAGPLLAFATVASTQAVCRRLADQGAPEGAVVIADYQTAGRGRHGRPWTAPRGTALLVSCLLRPPLPPGRWPELTRLAAGAVAEAVAATAGVTPRVKWPNDILVGERKLAGILAESVVGAAPCVVLGIGVNLLQQDDDWPPEIRDHAVSLAGLGRSVGRERLLAAVLARLGSRYERLIAESAAATAAAGIAGPTRVPGSRQAGE